MKIASAPAQVLRGSGPGLPLGPCEIPSRSPGNQGRLPPLGERDFDQVEIPGCDGAFKGFAGFIKSFADVIPGGDVDHGEHLDFGFRRNFSSLDTGRMSGLKGPVGIFNHETGIVDEQIRFPRGLDCRPAGKGVPGYNHRPARAVFPHHLPGTHLAPVSRDSLPILQCLECRTRLNAKADRFVRVETARTVILEQRVSERLGPVLDWKRLNFVIGMRQDVSPVKLLDLQVVTEPADQRLEVLHELVKAPGSKDLKRGFPVVEVVGFQQARQAQAVIQMKVGEVDLVHLHQTYGPSKLTLGTFTTVDYQLFSTPRDQHAGSTAQSGRHRSTGTQECDG